MNGNPPAGIELPSTRNAREFRYALWMMPGFVGCLVAFNLYPPMIGDPRFRSSWFVCLFALAAIVPRLWNIVRKRPIDDTTRPAAHVFSSLGYALIALVFLLNGGLDRFPPSEVRTTVVRKTVATVKGTKYHLIVSSLRPDSSQEDFTVDPDVFHHTIVGKTVTVELHKGFFGVPWAGNISPE
jgi:hypothetical protein